MKEKKKSDLSLLLDFAGSYKGLTFLGLGLSAVAMILGMLPYICIWLVARDLISAAPNWMQATGIARYGSAYVPMDESLAFCSLDISGRAFLVFNASFSDDRIGEFDTCLTEEFFRAFAFNAGITLHIRQEYGKNDHHICEAIFKAVAHALKQALASNGGGVLSTKGVL